MTTPVVVVGGADCVFTDLLAARDLCELSGVKPIFYVINDMIPVFDSDCIAITLHPDKIDAWLSIRQQHKWPKPSQVWAHRKDPRRNITHATPDWAGSSGLFACKIALEQHHTKIILCGVPMTVESCHFQRKTRWAACTAFRRPWDTHRKELEPYVRSMSGWTQEFLGAPDVAWLITE